MRILKRVEGSVLFLYADNPTAIANLKREAAARGVVDGARVICGGCVAGPEYLARFRAAGLFLDTLPFNAGTTASDALWAGLPVLTCPGETFAARMGASLLQAVGLPELIAATPADYEDMAVALAQDPARLARMTVTLDHNRLSGPP